MFLRVTNVIKIVKNNQLNIKDIKIQDGRQFYSPKAIHDTKSVILLFSVVS